MVVRLPHANMVVDPRTDDDEGEFSFSVNGRILTITRTDEDEDRGWPGWDYVLYLRAYLPTEDIPDFTSTVYTYWGLGGEYAPRDTTKAIFHPSVATIQQSAFYDCKSLVRVTIPDTVTHIEDDAFECCVSLKSIRLPRNLVSISAGAFYGCRSLQSVFLPPTVTHIGNGAFRGCASLRFCNLPATIERRGIMIFPGCDQLLTTVKYEYDGNGNILRVDEVHQWLMQRYASLPCHQACFSTSVSPLTIEGCFQEHGIELTVEVDEYQMTALHILFANPHVTGDCIRAYLQLAPEAAEQQDSHGMTPFQYLCRNDITLFLEDRSFSSLMALWYSCMPPQTNTQDNPVVRLDGMMDNMMEGWIRTNLITFYEYVYYVLALRELRSNTCLDVAITESENEESTD